MKGTLKRGPKAFMTKLEIVCRTCIMSPAQLSKPLQAIRRGTPLGKNTFQVKCFMRCDLLIFIQGYGS